MLLIMTLAAAMLGVFAWRAPAQSNVYSLNVVGYYNITCAAYTLECIANQLNTTNNSIGSLIPSPPPSSLFYKWTGIWNQYQFDPDDLTWYPDSAVTLNLGEAGLFNPPVATTLTFVGEVAQGNLVNTGITPVNQNKVVSSIVPQAGAVATDRSWRS